VVSFAGFWLPVGLVMPRVATGFVSFLSLTVFRNQAYAMVPKESTSLLWIDVAMLDITAIMWIVVLQNIAAQTVAVRYSRHAARWVDLLARVMVPITTTIILTMLFGLGSLRWKPEALMLATLIVLASSLLIAVVIIALFMCFLPQILFRVLAYELADKKNLWKEGLTLDDGELALIFGYLDEDRSGKVAIEEIMDRFEKVGIDFRDSEERDSFRWHIVQTFQDNGKVITEAALPDFRAKFKTLLGGELVRRVHLAYLKRADVEIAYSL